MKILLFYMMFIVIANMTNPLKEGKEFSLDLQTDKNVEIDFELTSQHLIIYFKPPSDKVDNPGQITVQISDSDLIDIDAFYQTALFKDINNLQKKNIKIHCQQGPCQSLIFIYGEESPLTIQEGKQLTIAKSHPVQYITLHIPPSSDYERIIFSIRSDDETILMDHVGLDIFGQVNLKSQTEKTRMFFIIESNDKETCSNCDIDIIISANELKTKSTLFVIEEIYTNSEIELFFDVKKIDFLSHFQKPNFYKLQIPTKFSHIILKVTSFAKLMPRIYGNVEQRPSSQEEALFDSSFEGEFTGSELDLVFHSSELQGNYLFLAFSGIQGLYQIELINIEMNPTLYIYDSLFSQISKDKVHYYSFCAQPLDDDNGQYIEIDLSILDDDDHTPDLGFIIKQCELQDCKSYQFEQLIQENYNAMTFKNNQFSRKITLKPSCSNLIDGFCWYTLAVSTKNSNNDIAHYSLSARFTLGQVKLKPNHPFSSMIIEADIEQLVFYYEPVKHDASITFTITSQHAAYMVSNDINCHPISKKCAKWFGGINNIVTLRGDDMIPGAYYIGVEGLKTTAYSFTVEVNNKKNETIIQLSEGQSYHSQLKPGVKDMDIMYFSFQLENDDTESYDIQIILSAGKFKVGIAVNSGKKSKLPSIQHADMISLNNFLIIESTNEDYYRVNGKYHGAVQYLWNNSEEDIDENTVVPFTITLTTSKTIKALTLNEVFFDDVLPDKINVYYFLMNMNSTKSTLLLSKTKIQPINPKKEVQLFLSATPERIFEGQAGFEIALKNISQTTFLIDEESQDKLCKNYDANVLIEDEKSLKICQFFIFAENHSKERQSYSLTLWNQGTSIPLHEGHALTFNMETIQNGQQMKFQYYPVSYKNEIEIFIQSFYGSISFEVQITSEESLSLSGYAHNIHSKSISVSALESCKPKCVLEITVQSLNQAKPEDNFTIMISQMFMEIRDGQPIEIVIKKPRYFIYSDLSSLLKNKQSSLQISVHEMSGRAIVCLSFADNNNLRMPNYKSSNCDFTLKKNNIELTSVNITNILDAQDLSFDNFPVLIIEISSEFQSKVILSIDKLEKNKLILATPARINLLLEDAQIYNFYNYQDQDLEFKVSRIAGYGYLRVSHCEKPTPDCEATEVKSKQFLAGQSSSSFILSKNSPTYCQYCYYLLEFSTAYNLTLQALLTITTQNEYVKLSQGMDFIDYLEGDDVNKYRVSIDTNQQIEVYIHVFGGSPGTQITFLPSQELFGPYSLNDSNRSDYYYAIIPPRETLTTTYNVSFKSTLAPHLSEDDMYIMISNLPGFMSSNYSISIYQGSGGNLIQDGLITQAVLSRIHPSVQLYYYHVNQHVKPRFIISCEEQQLLEIFNQYLIKTSARVAQNFDKFDFKDSTINLTSIDESRKQFEYLLPEQTGLYEITIGSILEENLAQGEYYIFDSFGKPQPQKNLIFGRYSYSWNFINRLTLDISINAQDIQLLSSRSSWQNGIVYPKQMKYYELYVPNNSMAIQLQNCQGSLTISYTQNYEHFIDEKFKKTVRTLSGSSYDTVLNLKMGPVYFALQGESDMGVYRFATQQPGLVDFPHGKVFVGSGGQIEYEIDSQDPDLITIKFSPIKCVLCDIMEEDNSIVDYQIMWASNEDYLNQIGKCDFYLFGNFYRTNQTHFGQSTILTFNLSMQEQVKQIINVDQQNELLKIFATVKATVRKFNNQNIDHYSLFYQNRRVYLEKNIMFIYKHKKTVFFSLITILFFLFLLMCCSMFYFLKRLRQLRNQQLDLTLQKQMQDAKEKQNVETQQKTNSYGKFEDEKDPQQ